MRRSLILVAVLVLAATPVAGCSNDSGSGSPTASAWALTGLPGAPEGDTNQVITVKIENTSSGQPQVGIGDADLVVQELVEGGLTRLAAMFNSNYPNQAGPVRSMRETDIGLVLPTGGTLAASGGAESTKGAIEAAGIPVAVEGDPGFSRDSSRSSPYNVMLDVSALLASLPAGPPPGPYLPFGDVPEDASGSPVSAIDLRWPAAESKFSYDDASGQWIRTDLPDATGFSFDNVVGLTLPVSFSGGTDAAGTPIPTMNTTGSGDGFVAAGGEVYTVRWSKASNSAPWDLSFTAPGTDQSAEFRIPPGRSWLALLPADGGSATFTTAPSGSPQP